ncbi:hypothetical protein [Candidatus Uabimicrobium sp. HlEnr_7]|uniref:hypothetical protein n=1 Tax=Candidatus Uabimicrobium helgolandensis TaxID=3095367 RepID=UPI003558782C
MKNIKKSLIISAIAAVFGFIFALVAPMIPVLNTIGFIDMVGRYNEFLYICPLGFAFITFCTVGIGQADE